MPPAARVRTCLWFDDRALPAAEFYCALLPDSRIDHVAYAAEDQETNWSPFPARC